MQRMWLKFSSFHNFYVAKKALVKQLGFMAYFPLIHYELVTKTLFTVLTAVNIGSILYVLGKIGLPDQDVGAELAIQKQSYWEMSKLKLEHLKENFSLLRTRIGMLRL